MNSFALTTFSLLLLFFALLSACTTSDPSLIEAQSLQRDAENVVAVFDAAVATGSDEALAVRSALEAVQLLRRGVYGGTSWTDQIFIVPSMAIEDVEPISQRLVFRTVVDEGSGKTIPKLRLRSPSEDEITN